MVYCLFINIILYDISYLNLLAFDKAELKCTITIFHLMQSPYLLKKKTTLTLRILNTSQSYLIQYYDFHFLIKPASIMYGTSVQW